MYRDINLNRELDAIVPINCLIELFFVGTKTDVTILVRLDKSRKLLLLDISISIFRRTHQVRHFGLIFQTQDCTHCLIFDEIPCHCVAISSSL